MHDQDASPLAGDPLVLMNDRDVFIIGLMVLGTFGVSTLVFLALACA